MRSFALIALVPSTLGAALYMFDLNCSQYPGPCNNDCFTTSVPPVVPLALRAPELLNGGEWNSKIDIWSFGCLIFEFATNRPLFALETFGCPLAQVRDQYRSRIVETLGANSSTGGCLEPLLQESLSKEFGSEDGRMLGDFLRRTLQENKDEREGTKELLQHPWITQIYAKSHSKCEECLPYAQCSTARTT